MHKQCNDLFIQQFQVRSYFIRYFDIKSMVPKIIRIEFLGAFRTTKSRVRTQKMSKIRKLLGKGPLYAFVIWMLLL